MIIITELNDGKCDVCTINIIELDDDNDNTNKYSDVSWSLFSATTKD